MKRLLQGLLMLLILAFTFIFSPTLSHAEEITIVGTGDGMNVLNAMSKAFSSDHPGITVSIPPSIGSGGGIKAVGADEFLVGRVARPIKAKEASLGLEYLPFAKVPVTFFVNPSVTVTDLTPAQVCAIYSGKITDWKDVGGSPGKIRVTRREDSDSSLAVLSESFPGFESLQITAKSKTLFNTQECVKTVEQTERAIGFAPLDVLSGRKVKPLSLGGISTQDPSYPSLTTLAFIYKKANRAGAIDQFLNFAGSADGQRVIETAGAIPATR